MNSEAYNNCGCPVTSAGNAFLLGSIRPHLCLLGAFLPGLCSLWSCKTLLKPRVCLIREAPWAWGMASPGWNWKPPTTCPKILIPPPGIHNICHSAWAVWGRFAPTAFVCTCFIRNIYFHEFSQPVCFGKFSLHFFFLCLVAFKAGRGVSGNCTLIGDWPEHSDEVSKVCVFH